MRRAHPEHGQHHLMGWGPGLNKKRKRNKWTECQHSSFCFLTVMPCDQPCLTSPGMPAPLPWTVPSNHGPAQLLPSFYCFWAGLSNEKYNEYKLVVDPLQKYYWKPYARLLWEWLPLLNVFVFCRMICLLLPQLSAFLLVFWTLGIQFLELSLLFGSLLIYHYTNHLTSCPMLCLKSLLCCRRSSLRGWH